MKVDYLNSADIQYLSSSSREILWRQSWWQRRSFWQCTCCRTTMLKEWPVVLATGPVLDPPGFIGLRGNGLTPSKIDDFLSEPSL
jgi:hypothetical protein